MNGSSPVPIDLNFINKILIRIKLTVIKYFYPQQRYKLSHPKFNQDLDQIQTVL
jgi:hypothetical protein